MLPIVNQYIIAQENIDYARRRRRCRDEYNIDNISEARFRELFRINKAVFAELIELLTPHMHVPTHSDKVSVAQKLLVALRFYATGSYQRCVGGDFNLAVSQTSAHRYIHEVTNAIYNNLSQRYIKFPSTRREMNEVKETFMNKFNFPGVIGSIDATHIAILKPKIEEHNFMNRKGFHSLNTQIICDANLKILSINANYPGATHDSFIWRQSQVRQYLLNEFNQGNLRGSWLIGDSGYPLEPFLITPIVNAPPGSPEARFTTAHMSARNCVERTIGVLKARFRCLLKERVARYQPRIVGMLVNVCSVLHNMCLEYGLEINEENLENNIANNYPQPNPQPDIALFQRGQIIRNNIVQNYFVE